ncbi:hypothetical protein B9Z55_015419 [Caenorhabditis nigoni]|uniref:Uncharacterized protein n=1 Tax=Caenorhabditis nigoni TaxID=1611254 RepID=A0A2G5UA53_9PELO|nr:hypothetical protein B9Z55_015419 [Caenorhabditis nigoni]
MSTTLNELSDAYIDDVIGKFKTEIQVCRCVQVSRCPQIHFQMKPPVARSPPTQKSAEKSEKPLENGNLGKIDNLPWKIELGFY